MRHRFTAICALLVAFGAFGQALAVTKDVEMIYSAVSSCDGALPSFEGSFRKRPLAMLNEGAGIAFASCTATSLASASPAVGKANSVTIFFRNIGQTGTSVPCTLADSPDLAVTGDEVFLLKSVTLLVGAGQGDRSSIIWRKDENVNGAPFRLPGISCALPPNVEIEQIKTTFTMDLGD